MPKDLPKQARAVIVGGGIVGYSVAYHLTQLGWKDVVLLEQFTMAAGTTGHGAGLVTQLRHTRALTDLSRYAADLYSRLEAETGQPTGFKQTGSITVARTQGRADEIKRTISMAKGFGVEIHSITPREAGELWPLMNTDDVVGAMYVPKDGQTTPDATTMAMGIGATFHEELVIDENGKFVPDVILLEEESSFHILNYNSPGATGALPFSAYVINQLHKKGLFEIASGGTIFLDEVGTLPTDTQVKLLRVIQEREFRRVGGLDNTKVDVRIIAATNSDLKMAVENGQFREDLYYRLNVITIHLPALRERKEDIPILTDHFIHLLCKENERSECFLDPIVLKFFIEYDWPGNVKQISELFEGQRTEKMKRSIFYQKPTNCNRLGFQASYVLAGLGSVAGMSIVPN